MSDCGTCGGCQSKKQSTSIDIDIIVQVLTKAIEHKLHYNEGHGERIAKLSGWMSEYLGVDSEMTKLITIAGYLHDIGMLSLADGILDKSGPLTSEEWNAIRQHPDNAFEYLKDFEDLREVQIMVRDHHEKYNGSGYPNGLSGQDIHLGARIIALCEAIDAMATTHPYREAMSFDAIEAEVKRNSGIHFDPWLCMHIVELLEKGRELYYEDKGIK